MKALVFVLSFGFSLFSGSAFADSNLTCRSSDKGWEEHWGGHKTCGDCFKKHGTCIETCSVDFTTCEVRGKDYQGASITLKGTGVDRFEAERNALRHCQRNFNDCSVSSCSNSSEQVSRQECPKPPGK